jgi:hypothetical protein
MSRRFLIALILGGLFIVLLIMIGVDGEGLHAQSVDDNARVVRESTQIEQLRPWLLLLFVGATFLFSVYTFTHQTKKSEFKEITAVSDERVAELKERFDQFADKIALRETGHADKLQVVSERLRTVEGKLDNVPTDDELHALALTVAEVQGDLKAMVADMRAVAKSNDRIEKLLMDGKRA